MTSTITKLPTATISKSADSSTSGPPGGGREHGIDQLHEQLVYHVTSFADSALYEAQRLMGDLHRSISQRTLDHDGSKGTAPVDFASVSATLSETLDCMDAAAEQLSQLNVSIRLRLNADNP